MKNFSIALTRDGVPTVVVDGQPIHGVTGVMIQATPGEVPEVILRFAPNQVSVRGETEEVRERRPRPDPIDSIDWTIHTAAPDPAEQERIAAMHEAKLAAEAAEAKPQQG